MQPEILILPPSAPQEERWLLPTEAVDFLGAIAEVHWAEIAPDAMKGNHYHKWRDEVLVYRVPERIWLYWGRPVEGSEVTIREITGPVTAAFLVPAGWAHAIKNGAGPCFQTVLGSKAQLAEQRDCIPHFLIS